MADIEQDFVHLARLALEQRNSDVEALIRRTTVRLKKERPDLASDIDTLNQALGSGSLARAVATPLPVDTDSRLELLKREPAPKIDFTPIWTRSLGSALEEVIQERQMESRLIAEGILPTRSLLLTGPPGTGKSLAAAWLAKQLQYPLLTLDLSAVMSSFLGKTGNNIRVVLDFARKQRSVLLLDEFDAIAKRRDDATEVGELKRLVTVLLQEIEIWPAENILIAATNHPDLLDPAVWRRFDRVIEFPMPTKLELERLVGVLVPDSDFSRVSADLLVTVATGASYADVSKMIAAARRGSVVKGQPFEDALMELLADIVRGRSMQEKLAVARALWDRGVSQRQISLLTGISRDTLRSRQITTLGTRGKDGA